MTSPPPTAARQGPLIPRIVHFVFGLRQQREPFHFVHYLALQSCRRVLDPDVIYLHAKHVPWGPWWDRVATYVTVREVDLVDEVLAADYSTGTVPAAYLYAHHADFIRLDALIEHGGVYADIDTVFVRPFPDELFGQPFVIGAEPPVLDEHTGEARPSLCNAIMMAEPGAVFARQWRARMADALDGTWSNHSGFLSRALADEMPQCVRVEPPVTFFSFSSDSDGLSALLEQRHEVAPEALSVHLWAHLWWARSRRDFSIAHEGWCTPQAIRLARTTFADLARPYLGGDGAVEVTTTATGPRRAAPASNSASASGRDAWIYLSLDESSGYGVAADRCRAALEDAGVEVAWIPFVPGGDWGLGYHPPPALDALGSPEVVPGQVVVAHLVPEYLPAVRRRCPQAFLVGHTAWETDRIPEHWLHCLDAADLVLVPSAFSAEAMRTSGVRTPVAVVPHVAPASWNGAGPGATTAWDDIADDVFVFYTVAEWSERKAPFLTIEAYLRAFRGRDDVVLVVKTSARDQRVPPPVQQRAVEPGTTAWSLARLLAAHPDPPPVRLVTRQLGEEELVALHRRGDCYVSLCRGEGWGLGSFDAAVHGNPVVTTGFGGHLDYLGGSDLLVRFDLEPVHDPAGYPSYAPDQRWAEPDVDHGAALLRTVREHAGAARARAATMAEGLRRRYQPAVVAEALRATVQSHRLPGGGTGIEGVGPGPTSP